MAYNALQQNENMNPVLSIGLVFLAIWGVNLAIQGGSVSSLNFILSNARVQADGLNVAIILTVNVQNPSNAAYVIKSVVGNLYINNNMTGTVSSFNTYMINPNSETPIDLKVLLQPSVVISDVISLFQGSGSVNLRLQGTANAGLSIPFDVQYTLIP